MQDVRGHKKIESPKRLATDNRIEACQLAHDSPMSGHTSVTKPGANDTDN